MDCKGSCRRARLKSFCQREANMDKALQIINLLNAAVPGIASTIQLIKNPNGTVSITMTLDQADQQFDANLQQITDWFKAHPDMKS